MKQDKGHKAQRSLDRVRLLLAENIKACRLAADMSQEVLAHKMGTIQSNISKLESGKGNPTLETLIELSDALEVPLESFFQANS